MAPVKTLIIGHSFVARASTYVQNNMMGNLNLPTDYHDVMFLGKSGATIRNVLPLFQTRVSNPDLVILDIGTNDLYSPQTVEFLACSVLDVAQTILSYDGVKRVILLGPLFRTAHGKHGAPEHFNARVRAFNHSLKQRLHRLSGPIEFWYHKGLSARVTGYLTDGVHLSSEGMRKYIRSLRRAVMKFTCDL
jgi:lysophospholipase L1-like esterase